MKKWSLQWTQFMQLRKQSLKKFRISRGVWTHDLAIPVRCSTNWAMKPLTLGAGQLWVHMFPWEKRRSNPGNKGEWIKTIIMTCNVVTVECKCSCKKKAWKIQAFRLAGIWTLTSRGSRGGAGGSPLIFRPKTFLEAASPPPYLRFWMTAPLPPYLKVWIHHCWPQWYQCSPLTNILDFIYT